MKHIVNREARAVTVVVLCSVAAIVIAAIASCRSGLRDRRYAKLSSSGLQGVEPAESGGNTNAVDPKTIRRYGSSGWVRKKPSPERDDAERREPEVLNGIIDEMGPFSARDAADGQWMLVSTAGGLRYVLVPAKLWVVKSRKSINEGDDVTVTGFWDYERGRVYLRAYDIQVEIP